ncbi:MAG: hypothetical protein JWM91_1762 [Rhodospirillales bacterium]|nr:hypothetical protein [Rhodospirillales bacterium]
MISETPKYLVRYANGSLSQRFDTRDQALGKASADDSGEVIPIAIVCIDRGRETSVCAGDVLNSAIKRWRDARPGG